MKYSLGGGQGTIQGHNHSLTIAETNYADARFYQGPPETNQGKEPSFIREITIKFKSLLDDFIKAMTMLEWTVVETYHSFEVPVREVDQNPSSFMQ